jgi:hypothetical protein
MKKEELLNNLTYFFIDDFFNYSNHFTADLDIFSFLALTAIKTISGAVGLFKVPCHLDEPAPQRGAVRPILR